MEKTMLSRASVKKSPSMKREGGRLPIAAFMQVAPVVLSGIAIPPLLVNELFKAIASAIEEGLKDFANSIGNK
jgi:hypothetical protein